MRKGYSFLCRNEAELNLALSILKDENCWVQSINNEDNTIMVNVSCETYNLNFVKRQLLPFLIKE